MEREEFARRIVAMRGTLYRVCASQLASPHDREDVVQEALKKAWEHQAQLKSEEMMQTWVIRILLNECRTIQRRQKRVQPADQLPEPGDDPLAGAAEAQALRRALWALPEKLRTPLVLHYIEGYGVQETAHLLRLPAGTVKTRMRAGRERLRAMLEEEVFTDENE